MKSRISMGLAMMLAALVISFVPAATVSTQPAMALSTCDWAQFVADVTVPDGTAFAAGTAFTKTWRMKNIGTCTWTTSYALVFDTGDRMGGPTSVNLPSSVFPGQTVDISIGLTAPSVAGSYRGFWMFQNAGGVRFGIGSSGTQSWWVAINVSGSGSSSPGVAYDFATNACSASWYSLGGSLPCPGTDGDPRGFVLKVSNPQLENGGHDTGNGLITNPQSSFNGDIHGVFPAFHVQNGDRFQSIVNCAYGATSCFVTFRLDYQIDSGPIYTLWSFSEKYDGLFFRTNVDLSSLAGQDVKFILTVLANGSAVGDRALWSNPAIMRVGPPPPPPPPSGTKFDFGTASSPVASGYTRVTEATTFSSSGYGWTDTSTLESRDRGAPSDDLKRDFVLDSSAARTFKTNLANGSYSVTVTMGDNNFAHDNMVVKANGATMLADVDTALGGFAVNTFTVTVSGGSLSLEFSDAGGTDPTWVVNAVSINPTSPPSSSCDRAQFVTDVTVPDGTLFSPGTAFSKTWRLKNVGTCTWTTSYLMVFDSGNQMGGPNSVNLPSSVFPGQTVDLTVNLTAPSSGGSYRGFWMFQNASGVRFGIGADGTRSWWLDIRVSGAPFPHPSSCDRAQFVTDVTVPDGTPFSPGTAFSKTWRLKNVGTCTWTTSYLMVFDSGNQMGGPNSVNLPSSVFPGQTVDLTVNLTAPSAAGSYRGFWKFQNASGVRFGIGADGNQAWWVDILVTGSAPPPPPPSGTQFDFGTASSPVASGYTRVTEATAYSSSVGYGWTDTSTLESRDRGAPTDDLKRDFVLDSSAARVFRKDLANGSYSVTVTMGDNNFAHDNMVVKANGTTKLPDVDTALGSFAVNTFTVTVSGGSLLLEFSDAGGTDPTWVVNGVSIVSTTPPPPPTGGKFDFGTATSPIAAGYTQVTETTAYSSSLGYGWTVTTDLVSKDTGAPPDDLKRDFVQDSSTARVFRTDLVNGDYHVTVMMGDKDHPHDNMVVKANGTTVLPDVDTGGGVLSNWAVNTFDVTVSGGSLSLEFSDAGGTDPTWVVNAVSIFPASVPPTLTKFDFGTASSPVAAGYTRVTETTAYSSGGFGWTDTSTLESRDRSALSDDLKRDFVMDSSAARTFKTDLPNGTYDVTVTMGDNDFAHDNMVVKANGTTMLPDVDAAAGAFAVNTFSVAVSGGTLSLEFSDAGGTDPTWVINAISIN